MVRSVELNEYEREWEELAATSAILRRAREVELSRAGLSVSQAGVLYFLKTSKVPLTPMKLSRLMHKQPHSVSGLVKRMETDGLVETRRDLKRKNWVRVSLTRKGEEAFKRQLTEWDVRNITACLSKSERESLIAAIRKLRARAIELLRQLRPTPYDELPV